MFRLTTQKEIDDNTPLAPGLYRIYWIKEGVPVTIRRVGGDDESGLLYIGQTDLTLRKRLNQFRCSAFTNSTNHSGALKYRSLEVLRNLIKGDELYAEIEPCTESYPKETEELNLYAKKFGEVPPLNG
jgi:hypothetical protein